jgi:hypothetical protein
MSEWKRVKSERMREKRITRVGGDCHAWKHLAITIGLLTLSVLFCSYFLHFLQSMKWKTVSFSKRLHLFYFHLSPLPFSYYMQCNAINHVFNLIGHSLLFGANSPILLLHHHFKFCETCLYTSFLSRATHGPLIWILNHII